VPGVQHAAVASQIPLGGNLDMYGVHLEERAGANPAEDPSATRYAVTPDYRSAMGIPLLSGRWLTALDTESAPPVVVINASMAERLFPGESPIGKRFRMGGGENGPWRTVVGVVGHVQHGGLDAAEEMQVYVPTVQWGGESGMTLVVHTRGAPAVVAGAVRAALRSVGPPVAVAKVATMEQLVSQSTAERRFALALFQGFAVVALLLAGAGLYGVLSASVAERTREIGIRSALGAPSERIIGLVMRQGALLTAIGLGVGVAGSVATSGLIARLLYGVSARDPVALLFVTAMLAALAGVACVLPAWRASRVDPVTALREG
jgi:putative ABC transport system permease protein